MDANSYVREPVRHPPLSVIDVTEDANHIGSEYGNIVLNRVNSECLRLAVMTGEYPWHHHPHSDELFLVVEGRLIIELADGRSLTLERWQAATVPAGMVHRTRAEMRTVNLCFEALAAETVFLDHDPRTRSL
ncbi:MAG: cupin domain-containing protein [Vicinamibacteraceae bacterium]